MKRRALLTAGLTVLLAAPALAQTSKPKITAQSIIVNPVETSLEVSVKVDRPGDNPSYAIGDPIRVSVTPNQDAYVYLFSVHADGAIDLVLPNGYSGGEAFVKANTTRTFPPANAPFRFNIGGPIGQDKVLAVAAKRKLNIDEIARFEGKAPLATVRVSGQENLARALSIVVEQVPPADWITDVAFYKVVGQGSSAAAQPAQSTPTPQERSGQQPVQAQPSVTRYWNIEPTVGQGATVLKDARASGGTSLFLATNGNRARFVLPREFPSGRYSLKLHARGDNYQGWPQLQMTINGNKVGGPVAIAWSDFANANFGEYDLSAGAVIDFTYVNDAFGGAQNKDRNAIVDYLNVDLVTGGSGQAAPAAAQPSQGNQASNQQNQGQQNQNSDFFVNRPQLQLPTYPGATIVRVNDKDNGANNDRLELDFKTNAAVGQFADYYLTYLKDRGWTVQERNSANNEVNLTMRKGQDDRVTFNVKRVGENIRLDIDFSF